MPSHSRPLRILVVDDNSDAADTLAFLVRTWGYDTRTVFDGRAAIAVASDYLPDVVLCDLAMPELDGCQVAQQLRRHAPHGTLFVAVTAHGDDDHRQRAAYAGFHAHLVKPVEEKGLHRLLECHVANL
jgi:two-component system, OmpR family, response regulator